MLEELRAAAGGRLRQAQAPAKWIEGEPSGADRGSGFNLGVDPAVSDLRAEAPAQPASKTTVGLPLPVHSM